MNKSYTRIGRVPAVSHIAIFWHPPDGPSHFRPPELVYALHVESPREALHTIYDEVLLQSCATAIPPSAHSLQELILIQINFPTFTILTDIEYPSVLNTKRRPGLPA